MPKHGTLSTTEKSFAIIRFLMKQDGATITEVSDHFEMAQSTVHDHLATLDDLGFVISDGDGYRLSLRFLDIGERVRNKLMLYRTATPELEGLADKTGEHASLVIEEHGRAVLVETVRGEMSVQIDTHSGMRIKLHTTAPGKAILAHLDESYVQEIIDRHGLPRMTPNTITEPEDLFAELERIREQGHALDREERIQGMQSIAVPIMDRNDGIRGAISVYGPSNRMEEAQRTEDIVDMLLRSANIIELNMNYQ